MGWKRIKTVLLVQFFEGSHEVKVVADLLFSLWLQHLFFRLKKFSLINNFKVSEQANSNSRKFSSIREFKSGIPKLNKRYLFMGNNLKSKLCNIFILFYPFGLFIKLCFIFGFVQLENNVELIFICFACRLESFLQTEAELCHLVQILYVI